MCTDLQPSVRHFTLLRKPYIFNRLCNRVWCCDTQTQTYDILGNQRFCCVATRFVCITVRSWYRSSALNYTEVKSEEFCVQKSTTQNKTPVYSTPHHTAVNYVTNINMFYIATAN